MSDLNTDYNDLLAGFAKSALGQDINNAGDTAPALPDGAIATGAVTPELAAEPAAVEPPTVAEPATPAVDLKAEPKAVDQATEPWSDWDSQPEPATTQAVEANKDAVDVLLDLGKALGVEAKNKDDLIKAIQIARQEADRVKAYDNVPAELKKAIELASKGADYLEYLKVNTVDYASADPVELYEDYVIDSSADKDGNVDSQKINDYLDSLDEVEKRIRGQELQRRLVSEQARRTVEIEQEAIRSREKHDTELKSALRGFNEIDGFKVDDNHRRELFEWISSGGIMKDLFYGPDGQFDAVKAAKVAFRNKYYDKLDAYQKTKIRNATKREVLKDITNAQITTPSKFADPTPKKGLGYGDLVTDLENKLRAI